MCTFDSRFSSFCPLGKQKGLCKIYRDRPTSSPGPCTPFYLLIEIIIGQRREQGGEKKALPERGNGEHLSLSKFYLFYINFELLSQAVYQWFGVHGLSSISCLMSVCEVQSWSQG